MSKMTFSEVTLLQTSTRLPFIRPNDAACQQSTTSRLAVWALSATGSSCNTETNFWARDGAQVHLPCFVEAHSDALFAQNPDGWVSQPISGIRFNNKCYGDMTSSSHRQGYRSHPFFSTTTVQRPSLSAGIAANHTSAPEDFIKLNFSGSTASGYESFFDPLHQDLDHAVLDDQPGCTGKSLPYWNQAETLFERLFLTKSGQCQNASPMTEFLTRQPFLSKRLASS